MSAVRSPPADSEERAERYGNGNYQAPILHDHPLRNLDSMGAQRQLTTSFGRSTYAHISTFRLAIQAPDNGHSLSAIFPVSPCSIGHFGKVQSGSCFQPIADMPRMTVAALAYRDDTRS